MTKQMVVKANVLACLRQYKLVDRETDNDVLERILSGKQELDQRGPAAFTPEETQKYVQPRKKKETE